MPNLSSLVELSCYSAIDVTGIDASKFLQGQLTINVNTPTNQQSCLAALCNPKGRIISLFHLATIEDGFRLIMPKSLIEVSLSHLNKYAVFFKAEITENVSSAIIGAINLPMDKLSAKVVDPSQACYQLNELPMAFLLTGPDQDANNLSEALATPIKKDSQVWFSELAKYGVCWLSEQTSAKYLPHNLNLPNLNAVDFKKGCFTGQEVIARMQYKGKLKQQLKLLQSTQTNLSLNESKLLASQQKLLQGESRVGEIVCSSLSEQKRWLVLALVKDSANNQQNFTVNAENSPILELVE